MSHHAHHSEPEIDFAPLGYHSHQAGRSIDMVQFLLSVWKPVTIGLVAGLAVGVVAYLILGPAYEATVRVLVSKKASVPLNNQEANRYGERGEHVHLIMSEEIVRRALYDHGLLEHRAYSGEADPYEAILDNLLAKRSAGQDSSFLNVLEITFQHKDPQVAGLVLEAIVDSYADWLADHREHNAEQLMNALTARRDVLVQEIETLEQEHLQYWTTAPYFLKSSPIVMANGMMMPAPSFHELQLQQIEQDHARTISQRVRIEAQLAALDQMLQNNESREELEFFVLHALSSGSGSGSGESGGSPGGGGSSAIFGGPPAKAELDSQLLAARMIETRLLHNLGENHTDVRRVRAQIDAILALYRTHGITPPPLGDATLSVEAGGSQLGVDLVSVFRKTLEFQLDQLQRQLELHESRLVEAQNTVREATVVERRDQQYKEQIAEKKRELNEVSDQINSFVLSREQEGYRMEPISQIRVNRSLKRILKIVGACGLLGMLAVFCLAYFREWYDTSVKTVEEIRRALVTTVLGAVPRFRSSFDQDQLAIQSGLDPALCYYHRPGSREAEAYRTVRTTLFLNLPVGSKIIQISSAEPGDGKSVTVANLAIAMAQSGKRVLLIDGDLRQPKMHMLFGVPQAGGLSETLRGELTLEQIQKPSRVAGLTLITGGLCPANPAELLSAGNLEGLLQTVRHDYDIVLIDSPPLLAVSDPSIIAPCTDGMLLVVRMEKNNRATLDRARDILETHGLRVIGAIANDVMLTPEEAYIRDKLAGYFRHDQQADRHVGHEESSTRTPAGKATNGELARSAR